MELEEKAKIICDLFKQNKPFLIGRNGTIEIEALDKYLNNVPITFLDAHLLELNAGIFPENLFEDYFINYMEALKNVDIMAEGWYERLKSAEQKILNNLNPNRSKVLFRNLEPYYVKPDLRWTQYLDGKRVAIINAFAETCESQTYISKGIWLENADTLLPSNTVWVPIRTYFSPKLAGGVADWPSHIKSWKDAVQYTVERVLNEGCEIAIIGCGGLGMIIGHELKKKGLQCIVMGGAIQILFGIKGGRWKNHEIISNFFNKSWVSPSDTCKPNNSKLIENNCYW